MSRSRALLLAGLCALLGAAGKYLADSYVSRLPNHEGYYLVTIPDQIAPQYLTPSVRPRHTVVVVVDGLRADYALAMQSVRRLRAAGLCYRTYVGAVSVSRPVYAVLSTGLEQDRTGSRNNDDTSPLRAESIWQVARRAGLQVTAVSELPWFRQLFPGGFDRYQLVARAADHFLTPESELGDLTLIHPVYVDENGHQFGGGSPEYAAAARRADAELGRLLDRLDLTRDLVVFTADHGHTDRGGHGADSPEVAHVLSCFGGHGIRRPPRPEPELPAADQFDTRLIAPAIAVLLQLPFPPNLRAGEDSLDALWALVDPDVYPAGYLTTRHAAVQHLREVNRVAVGRWLGRPGPAEWSELYAHARRAQLGRGLLFLLAAYLFCRLAFRQLLPRRPLFFVLWTGGTLALLALLYTAVRGSFDFNSVNSRAQFVLWGSTTSLLSGLVAMGAHLGLWRERSALAVAQVQLSVLVLLTDVAHILAFGWPLGFPLPDRVLIFLPFISNAFLTWNSILGCLVCLSVALYPARVPSAPRR